MVDMGLREQHIDPAGCARLIAESRRAVALTGAGVSTAAGIPDFRGPEGLYVTRRYDPDRVFDIDAFRRDPEPFYEFTRDFLTVIDGVEPTFTHRFLAWLEGAPDALHEDEAPPERFRGVLSCVVTQNVDPLHATAGSTEIIAVHGSYATSRCLDCGARWDYAGLVALLDAPGAPRCECGGVVKPDIVFFGEEVRDIEAAAARVHACDLLLALGSSLMVHPAAGLPALSTAPTVIVNRGDTALLPAPHRYRADADLDGFFRAVADELRRM